VFSLFKCSESDQKLATWKAHRKMVHSISAARANYTREVGIEDGIREIVAVLLADLALSATCMLRLVRWCHWLGWGRLCSQLMPGAYSRWSSVRAATPLPWGTGLSSFTGEGWHDECSSREVVLKMEIAWLGNARFRKFVDHEFGAC
jgi:hypothetical protein